MRIRLPHVGCELTLPFMNLGKCVVSGAGLRRRARTLVCLQEFVVLRSLATGELSRWGELEQRCGRRPRTVAGGEQALERSCLGPKVAAARSANYIG